MTARRRRKQLARRARIRADRMKRQIDHEIAFRTMAQVQSLVDTSRRNGHTEPTQEAPTMPTQTQQTPGGDQRPRDGQWGPAETAEYLGIHEQTLYEWRKRDAGPPWERVNNKWIRYQREDVEEYKNRYGKQPVPLTEQGSARTTDVAWEAYGECPMCHAKPGSRCISVRVNLAGFKHPPPWAYLNKPHLDRPKRSDAEEVNVDLAERIPHVSRRTGQEYVRKPIKGAVLRYLTEHVGEVIFIRDMMNDLNETKDRILGAMVNLRRENGARIDSVVMGEAYRYRGIPGDAVENGYRSPRNALTEAAILHEAQASVSLDNNLDGTSMTQTVPAGKDGPHWDGDLPAIVTPSPAPTVKPVFEQVGGALPDGSIILVRDDGQLFRATTLS